MAKARKRREQKKFVPQSVRVYRTPDGTAASKTKKRNINWIQIAAITIGVLVILSMILAMFLPSGGMTF